MFGLTAMVLLLSSCQQRRYRIGVSQCYHNEWNLKLDQDIRRACASHPEIKLESCITRSGVQGQIADMRSMISRHFDVIIVSPEVEDSISPIINEAMAAGIRVILIDSEATNCDYSAIIRVDNRNIGYCGAQFAIENLPQGGEVIYVLGVRGSANANDRHTGFLEGIYHHPEIQVVDSCYTDWTYESAYPLLDSLVALHPHVRLIACQNDVMAYAAYDVCVKHQLDTLPFIIGIDGLMGPGQGIEGVREGKLAASCTNPTGAEEAIKVSLDILKGRPFDRVTTLNAVAINPSNIDLLIDQAEYVSTLNRNLEHANGELSDYLREVNLLQILIIVSVLLFISIIGFFIYANYATRQRAKLRLKVQQATQTKLSFFTNVSHSFRTPISLISSPVQTLIQEGELSPRQRELLDIVDRQTQELQQLTDKVIDVLQSDLLRDGESLDAVVGQAYGTAPTPAEMRRRKYEAHPEVEASQDSRTVLVIDDNADMRTYLSHLLTRRGYLVLTAPNGEEGLHMAQQNIPDLIISDVMMPIMDGLECCRLLKAGIHTSHIPVIMISAYALDDQRIRGYESGADAYLTKPFKAEVLCARIANLIDSHKTLNATKDRSEEFERAEMSTVDRSLVNHFHSFVTEHIADADLGIQQLCDEFNMSRVQVYRKCKSLTGQAPGELIRIIRLKAATQLLQTTDKPISTIAYETGFSSPSYFSKCYKDMYGKSPTDVQRNTM